MMRTGLILGLAAGLAAAGPAAAQYSPPPSAAAPTAAAAAPAPKMTRAQEREAERQEKIQKRAAKLRQALQLRPDQDRALMAYIGVLYPAGRDDDGPSTRNMSTPQKLDVEYTKRVQRLNEWKREADAAKSFYAQLSAAQRQAADTMDVLVD